MVPNQKYFNYSDGMTSIYTNECELTTYPQLKVVTIITKDNYPFRAIKINFMDEKEMNKFVAEYTSERVTGLYVSALTEVKVIDDADADIFSAGERRARIDEQAKKDNRG